MAICLGLTINILRPSLFLHTKCCGAWTFLICNNKNTTITNVRIYGWNFRHLKANDE